MPNEWWSVGCQLGLHCIAGQCQPLPAEGQPCDSSGPRFCDAFSGMTCMAGRCALSAQPQSTCSFTPDGEPCERIPELYVGHPCLFPAVCESTAAICQVPSVPPGR
jgi:hypothetical protein